LDKTISFATREQELLLQAALLKGKDAINAWYKWKNAVDLEGHPDNGSYRLFPLLYKNLELHGIEHPFMHRLRGIYRQAWYKNQRLFYDMSQVLQFLHDAGIRTMVLKGAALTVLNYKNYAVRPMADVDVLVHPSQAILTLEHLKRAGWIPLSDIGVDDLYYSHSVQCNDSSGKEFDLHWHPYWDACRENTDRDFWDRALPITFANVSTLAPDSTDNLLHAIIHGVRFNEESPIRWIADAVILINSPDREIDWIYFISQAEKHRVVLRIREALKYVQDKFNANVPKEVMDQLDHFSVSRPELIEYQEITTDPENRNDSLLAMLAICLSEYRRINGNSRVFAPISGFPRYLQWRFRQKSMYHLSSFIAAKSINKVSKKLFSKLISRSIN
jgi:hypothetical protein